MTEKRGHHSIRGKIHYTSNKPGRENAERGREWFVITKHNDGSRTLSAHSEIDDFPHVTRDVVQTIGPDLKPRDAFVRLTVGGDFYGSSWFKFSPGLVECEGFTAQEGRFSQRFTFDGPIGTFGTHPIQGDAWHLHLYDISEGPGRKVFPNLIMSSLDHRGATGPMACMHPKGFRMRYVGKEKLTVGAGTFDTLHFMLGDEGMPDGGENAPGKHPPYEIWCTDDGDFTFLKATVAGYMMTQYELVELEEFDRPAIG